MTRRRGPESGEKRGSDLVEEPLLRLVADLDERDIREAGLPIGLDRCDQLVQVGPARDGRRDVVGTYELAGGLESAGVGRSAFTPASLHRTIGIELPARGDRSTAPRVAAFGSQQ